MQKRKTAVFIAAALAVGLVAGSIGIAAAASSGSSSAKSDSTSQHSLPPTGTPPPGGPGAGPRGDGPGTGGVDLVRVVAKLTNETTASVIASRETTGSSFASIAKKKGVIVAEIVKLAMAAPKAAVDSKLSDGLLTKSEASRLLSHLKDSITREVNSTQPFRAHGDPGGPGSAGPVGPGPGPQGSKPPTGTPPPSGAGASSGGNGN